MVKAKKVRRNITIDKDAYEKFQEISKLKGTNFSGWINAKIIEFNKENDPYAALKKAEQIAKDSEEKIKRETNLLNKKTEDILKMNAYTAHEVNELKRRVFAGEIPDGKLVDVVNRIRGMQLYP